MTAPRWGSDLVVDLIAEAGISLVSLNPGASVRGLHDSLVHSKDGPQLVLCLHEAVAVGVAQGYAKAAGRPMGVLLHDVVGLQNASMAIYNAWCDRVPMLLIGGTGPMSKANRRPWIDWIHTASAQAEAVRHYVKWDDQPHDVESLPESFARAMTLATSVPQGPVYWCLDVDLQERELADGDDARARVSDFAVPTPPAAGPQDLDEVAEALRRASMPLLIAGYSGATSRGFELLIELAEQLHAPVLDVGPRLNFPTSHDLWAEALGDQLAEVDLVVLVDVDDPLGALASANLAGAAPSVVAIGPGHLRIRSWAHDYQALVPSSRHVTSAAEPALAGLVERLTDEPAAGELVDERRARLSGRAASRRKEWSDAARSATATGAVPKERLVAELGVALEGEDWVLAAGSVERVEHKLWDLERPHQWCGHSAGGGLGYNAAAAIGVGLAVPTGTIVIDVQGDGDLLFAPQALWTAANLRSPVLIVVHNNRAYGNTVGHAQAVAAIRDRAPGYEHVGSRLADPPVDFAALARSFGVAAWGPVSTVETLQSALAEALATVREGGPALVDVLTPAHAGPDTTEEP